jgi:tRNA(Ile)-lysidine synthase
LLQKLEKHIDENLSFLKGKKLLIACSGGLDSIVLTDLLYKLKHSIGLAHCNFKLRIEESDQDEAFVEDLADKLSVPFYSQTFETKNYAKKHKLSIQMAARELRYLWFEEIVKDFKYDYLLTAHHADDDLETFFINLSRGTGLKGLTGIPEINNNTVRPLLIFGREEILVYAKRNNLYWREDSSNKKTDYLRNKLRLEVLPEYKKASSDLLKSFQTTRKHLQDAQLLIDDYMMLIYNIAVTQDSEGYHIAISKLEELPNTNALLYELLSPFDFTDLKSVSELLSAQSGKQLYSKTHRLLKNRDELILTEIKAESDLNSIIISENEKKIDLPFPIEFNSTKKIGNISSSTIYVDKDKLHYPLSLRKWKEGDVFQPFGMKGKKKLSKFFKDEKLSLVSKEKIWVLCSNDQIIWVVGFRPDDRFKVEDTTKEILQIIANP